MQIFKVGLKTPEGKLPESNFFAVCHLSRRYKTEAVTGGLPLTVRHFTAVCLACEPLFVLGFSLTAPFRAAAADYTIGSLLWKPLLKRTA